MKDGFIKTAAAAPALRVADPGYNADRIIDCMREAAEKKVRLLVLPELCLTGATCGHLFFQRMLLDAALDGLKKIVEASAEFDTLVFVGLPLAVGGRVYSVAAAVYAGELLGLVPRTNVAGTVFSSPDGSLSAVDVAGLYSVCMSRELLFEHSAVEGLSVGVQFGADAAMPVQPAIGHAAAGATVIAVLSDEPMSVYSAGLTKASLATDTRRMACSVVYAAPGRGESTTDKAYSGLCLIVEEGDALACAEGGGMAVTELDVQRLTDSRRRSSVFAGAADPHGVIEWGGEPEETELTRRYSDTPMVPDGDLKDFCERALDIQAFGLIKRMEYTGLYRPVIGVSGGVDSTLVMLACARALDMIGMPRSNIVAITMPCFGTTDRTKNNAITIAEQLGAELRVVPIGDSVKAHFETIGHAIDDYAVVFENAQARERTMVLLDVANKVGGLDVGTKDLSEQADGWCTFNGDQISNYDINAGLTKTMVRAVVKYIAETTDNTVLADALHDVWDTPVTPELLPISAEGDLLQKSEDSVGPYILQDFFLFHMIMRGEKPEKVLRLAVRAFDGEFDRETIVYWLKSYCRRFFSQQFKRSTSADGPAVMGFTLSPRDGHKMPSDAEAVLWSKAVSEL